MACGIGLPVVWLGTAAIMVSALLVGATFTVITMAGFQEGREIGGVRMIAAMASAFAASLWRTTRGGLEAQPRTGAP